MNVRTRTWWTHLGFLCLAAGVNAASPPPLDGFLREGRIKEGLAAYAAPTDDAGRFSLAVLQALAGLQQFSAGFNRLGVRTDFLASSLPFFRAVIPGNQPTAKEPATPAAVASLFRELRAALRRANTTLGGMGATEFKVEVNLSQARLDFDGDGTVATNELLMASLARFAGTPPALAGGGDLVIRFDSADAMWLKAYTHLLGGVLDVFLAYDWRPVWDQCAHLLFVQPLPPPAMTRFSAPEVEAATWVDLIAAVHDLRLELVDQDGLRHARDEWRAMIASSRVCWQRVLAETDNDHEWLPSPQQTGPGGAKVTQEQITAWLRVLDELDAIAGGTKLLPHWRVKPGWGINVDKLVSAPPRLDLVLWVQGTALIPFIEEGPVSDATTWRQLTAPFGPGFFSFAIWSN